MSRGVLPAMLWTFSATKKFRWEPRKITGSSTTRTRSHDPNGCDGAGIRVTSSLGM